MSITTEGPYAAAWRDLRRRQWLMWAVYLTFFPSSWLLSAIDAKLLHHHMSPNVVILAGTLWFIAFIASNFWISAWRCPRCHEEFTKATWYRNAMTRHCLSCGLPRWAPDDPGPNSSN
jgi:hypothetical protein